MHRTGSGPTDECARPAVVAEILRQLGVLSETEQPWLRLNRKPRITAIGDGKISSYI
jgi:hypothetical protein